MKTRLFKEEGWNSYFYIKLNFLRLYLFYVYGQLPEEDIRFSGTGITDNCDLTYHAGIQNF